MEELQHHLPITARRNGDLVCRRQHPSKLEIVWTKLSSLDSWETLVVLWLCAFIEVDGFSLALAGAGKSVLWYVNVSIVQS